MACNSGSSRSTSDLTPVGSGAKNHAQSPDAAEHAFLHNSSVLQGPCAKQLVELRGCEAKQRLPYVPECERPRAA